MKKLYGLLRDVKYAGLWKDKKEIARRLMKRSGKVWKERGCQKRRRKMCQKRAMKIRDEV